MVKKITVNQAPAALKIMMSVQTSTRPLRSPTDWLFWRPDRKGTGTWRWRPDRKKTDSQKVLVVERQTGKDREEYVFLEFSLIPGNTSRLIDR